ncbi:ark1 [Symbiodinium natans]|uniref:Ark1 protein n=1 Tax=Symbiodinium natans TaxID=878477 RepID=A0A812TKX8_9DINO|nr:ark1 [Symbiodinium natans]
MAASSCRTQLKVCFFLFLLAGKEVYVVNAERAAVDVFTELAELQQAAANLKGISRHGAEAEPLCDGALWGCINPKICTDAAPCAVKPDADLANGYAVDVDALSRKIDAYSSSQAIMELSVISYELKDMEQYDKAMVENKGGPRLRSKMAELADTVDRSLVTLAAAMPNESSCSMVELVNGLNDAKSKGNGVQGTPDDSKAFLKKVFPEITNDQLRTVMAQADVEAREVHDCDSSSTPDCREALLKKQDDKFLRQADITAENLAESEASFVQLVTKFGAKVPHDHLSALTETQRRENTWAALQLMDNKTAWEELKQAARRHDRHDASSALQNGAKRAKAASREKSMEAQLEAAVHPIVLGIIVIVIAVIAVLFLTAAILIPLLLALLGVLVVGATVCLRR